MISVLAFTEFLCASGNIDLLHEVSRLINPCSLYQESICLDTTMPNDALGHYLKLEQAPLSIRKRIAHFPFTESKGFIKDLSEYVGALTGET